MHKADLLLSLGSPRICIRFRFLNTEVCLDENLGAFFQIAEALDVGHIEANDTVESRHIAIL